MTIVRGYFSSATASPGSPAFGAGWDDTGSAVRRELKLAPALSGSASTASGSETSLAQTDVLTGQFTSRSSADGGGAVDMFPAGPIEGTFSIVTKMRESGIGQADMFQQVRIHIFDSTMTTLRGTIYSGRIETSVSAVESDPNAELPIPQSASRIMEDVPLEPGTTFQTGDRVVVEHGCRSCNTDDTSRTCFSVYADDDHPDMDLVAGLTDNDLPWIEFNLVAAGCPTGYEVRVDGGESIDVGTDLSYLFEGLDEGTEYMFEVRSYGEDGFSSWVGVETSTLVCSTAIVAVGFPETAIQVKKPDGSWVPVQAVIQQ